KPVPWFVPPPIAHVIERAIAPDPQHRFNTMEEMLAAIEKATRETGLVASSDDVARLVEEQLGDILRERRNAIQQAVSASKQRRRDNPASTSAPIQTERLVAAETWSRPPAPSLPTPGAGVSLGPLGTTVGAAIAP